jgi:hypothetical protein
MYANLLMGAILVWRLFQTGLFRPYNYFFIYQLYDAFESSASFYRIRSEHAQLLAYIGFQSPKLIASALVVLEIYRLSLEPHHAIARFGRKIVLYAFAACVLVAFLWVYFIQAPPKQALRIYFFAIERSIDSADLLFLGLMGAFLLWFPVRLRRNLVAYVSGFVIYFLTKVAALTYSILGQNIWQKQFNNVALYAITLLCLWFWIRSMRPVGEKETTVTGHRWNPEENERLIEQLNEINNSLQRMAK